MKKTKTSKAPRKSIVKKPTTTLPFRTASLFSGIGGIEAGLVHLCNIVRCVEIDKQCHAILRKHLPPNAVVETDVREVQRLENIDLITAGFPCQDISQMGRGRGLAGARSGLVHEIFRILQASTPPIPLVFLENVQLLRLRGLDVVLAEFGRLGYNVRWCTVEAMMMGAPHRRKRMFILACKNDAILPTIVAQQTVLENVWLAEPRNVSRVVPVSESTPSNRSRLKMLGNAVMPQMARYAFHTLYNAREPPLPAASSAQRTLLNATNPLPAHGFFFCDDANVCKFAFQGRGKIGAIVFPPTLQRFKSTHSIPTPTASDHMLLKPTNTQLNRAFRPGVNKSVSLNRYVQMFPTSTAPLPALDSNGLLREPLQFRYHLNADWVEWLMGFQQGWTA
jgi:DNA (cytosine-5)-methyltransferase 1